MERGRILGSARAEQLILDVAPPIMLAVFIIATERGIHTPATSATLLLVVAPLLIRRRFPVPVLLLVALGVLLTASRGGSIVADIAALSLAAFTVGEHTSSRTAAIALILGLAATMSAAFLLQYADSFLSVVVPFVVLVPTWLVGDAVRARRLERVALVEAGERDQRDQLAQLEAAAAEQRREIARELHDVLAHSVSVMVVQAGAARQVLHTDPAKAVQALLAVEETGREAMAELRGMLGLLTPNEDGGGVAPQPGANQIDELVARVREAGLPAELQVDGAPRDLPPGTDVAAYRIVQEALTNALRYADRARTLVHLAYEPHQLRVEVLDDGPAAGATGQGSGLGLDGMRQRAASAGGTLEAGPRLGGGYAVRAWLPLTDAS
jgi:signal transduction histidine kinase